MIAALREERWAQVCAALWCDAGGQARAAWATPVVQAYLRGRLEALRYAREEARWDNAPYDGPTLEDDLCVGWLFRATPPAPGDLGAFDGLVAAGDDVRSRPRGARWEALEARGGVYAYPGEPASIVWDVVNAPGGVVFEPFAHNPDPLYASWRAFTAAAQRLMTPEALVEALASGRWVGLRAARMHICRVALRAAPWAGEAARALAPW